jgi:hypothetical protein
MEQIILLAASAGAGAGLVLFSVLLGFWMGKKTVRPTERAFKTEKVTNEDSHILDTADYFEERTNREGNDERVKTI